MKLINLKKGEISLDISADEFKRIDREKLENMGLRTIDMDLSYIKPSAAYSMKDIILKDFKFKYGNTPVLDIDELSVPEGAVIAVIGKNGAGKSTFSKCLCGLDYSHMLKTGKEISKLKDTTIFVVTHDPELVARCATHILHLENGKVKDFYPVNEEGVKKLTSFFTMDGKEK